MITDITAIFLKEWNEYLHARGTQRGTILMILFPVLIFGIIFPLQAGRQWVETPVSIISFAWIPLLFVSATTADSFAGERERHTLETLLASRLSDRGILFGKLIAATSYGLLITAFIVAASIVTVTIADGHGEFLFYPLTGFLWGMGLCVLASLMIAGIGILVSLRAATVRQAHQTMSFGIIIIGFTPMMFFKLVPKATRDALAASLSNFGLNSLLTMVAAALLIIDAAILLAAMRRFVRTRMTLD